MWCTNDSMSLDLAALDSSSGLVSLSSAALGKVLIISETYFPFPVKLGFCKSEILNTYKEALNFIQNKHAKNVSWFCP